jgi:D-glycero-alpha-D-manno-heptose 1-phosphate guanylyltransferase
MVKEAIILAGGLGTRLRSEVSDLPKCMAPVKGKPFLHYVIEYCKGEGIERFVFSLGYKFETVAEYLQIEQKYLSYSCCIENEPLGTGGAIMKACGYANDKTVAILNGDTLYKANLQMVYKLHSVNESDCTLALKPMKNFDRYGVVEIDEKGIVKQFKEKQYYEEGLINGGIYLLNKKSFMEEVFPEKFSFEKDYLEEFAGKRRFFGLKQEGYFIDIGIPEDYRRAQTEL